MSTEGRIVEVESFSTPGVRYEVDLAKKTCSCPAFQKAPRQPCKHLRSFEGLLRPSPHPDPNEALSAFIKAIRLRRPEDAATWLLYLWRLPQYRGRAQRRLFIASAEDNLSVGVMRKVSAWYNSIERVKFESAVIEIARICATRNWWAQPDGHAYIRAWAQAEKEVQALEGLSESALYAKLESDSCKGELLGALTAFGALYSRMRVVPHRIAEVLSVVAHRLKSLQAKRLAALYQANIRTVGPDGNLAAQALYAALVGRFGDQGTPEPSLDDLHALVAAARKDLADDAQIPPWALDGIHTGRFKDRRFAGTVQMMAACCRAYERFGRLSVEDRWPTSLYEEAAS